MWNSDAVYSCKAGYSSIQGPQWTIQCLENGVWEASNLTCVPDDESKQQLAVKSREKASSETDSKGGLSTTHTVVSAGVISSVILAVIAAIGVVLIRRYV